MGYADYLKQMLHPLGVYELNEGYSAAELEAAGESLDMAEETMTGILESTALGNLSADTLTKLETLFPIMMPGEDEQERVESLKCLFNVGDESFTAHSLERQLAACGLYCNISETDEKFAVDMSFQNICGELTDEEVRVCREIMPAHLKLNFVCSGLTWDRAEAIFPTWDTLESSGLTIAEIMALQ